MAGETTTTQRPYARGGEPQRLDALLAAVLARHGLALPAAAQTPQPKPAQPTGKAAAA